MSYYALLGYVGLSMTLSFSYSCLECLDNKFKLPQTSCSILFVWVICTLIITSILAAVMGEMAMGQVESMHVIIAGILVLVSLCVSSSIVYYTFDNDKIFKFDCFGLF